MAACALASLPWPPVASPLPASPPYRHRRPRRPRRHRLRPPRSAAMPPVPATLAGAGIRIAASPATLPRRRAGAGGGAAVALPPVACRGSVPRWSCRRWAATESGATGRRCRWSLPPWRCRRPSRPSRAAGVAAGVGRAAGGAAAHAAGRRRRCRPPAPPLLRCRRRPRRCPLPTHCCRRLGRASRPPQPPGGGRDRDSAVPMLRLSPRRRCRRRRPCRCHLRRRSPPAPPWSGAAWRLSRRCRRAAAAEATPPVPSPPSASASPPVPILPPASPPSPAAPPVALPPAGVAAITTDRTRPGSTLALLGAIAVASPPSPLFALLVSACHLRHHLHRAAVTPGACHRQRYSAGTHATIPLPPPPSPQRRHSPRGSWHHQWLRHGRSPARRRAQCRAPIARHHSRSAGSFATSVAVLVVVRIGFPPLYARRGSAAGVPAAL